MILAITLKRTSWLWLLTLLILSHAQALFSQDSLKNLLFEQRHKQAISYYQEGKSYQCLLTAERMDSLASDSLQSAVVQYIKGASYVQLRQEEKAYTHLQKAVKYFRAVRHKEYLAKTYSALGALSAHRGQVETGIEFFRQSFDLFKEVGNLTEMYKIRGNLGIMQAEQGAMSMAVREFKAVKKLAAAQGDSASMVPAYLNLGQLFIRTGQVDSALLYLRTALRWSEKHGTERGRADGFNSLSGCYFMKRQYDSAYYYGEKALDIYYAHKHWAGAMNILHRMASSKEELGFYKKATQLQWEHIAIKDSLYNQQKQQAIAEAESKFKLAEKNYHIALLEAQSQAESREKWLYMALLALAVAIAVTITFKLRNQYKLRQREQKIHRQQMALEATQKEKLEDELKLKERALTKESLRIVQKNQQFEELHDKLHTISDKLTDDGRKEWVSINSSIKYALSVDKEWKEFGHYFESIHPQFHKILNTLKPPLTAKEKRLCALIKINMNTHEIASVLGISPGSVKKARQRLRKKLELDQRSLKEYLDQLSKSD